ARRISLRHLPSKSSKCAFYFKTSSILYPLLTLTQRPVGTWETLPPPKRIARALHGVGVVGAEVPIDSDRILKLNIYVRVDYEEWFDGVEMASAPLGEVACIIAELAGDMQRVGPKIQASNHSGRFSSDNARGICFGQLRLTQLYSYDGIRIYPEIVAVTHVEYVE
ncbi:hypothetical protein EI94DRAFT_1737443, partial [Lactarius quietus]